MVFNTHLDHVSDEARINGIAVVLDKIQQFGGYPSMIMGDFNATEDSETYKSATENFDDVKYLTENTMTGATYQNWGAALDDDCIDYLMILKPDLPLIPTPWCKTPMTAFIRVTISRCPSASR